LQSLSTGVISLDAENRVTTINEAAVSMFRLENAAAENSLLSEIVSAEDLIVFEKLLIRARRLGHATEQTVLLREQTTNDNENGFSTHSTNLPVALTATALERGKSSRKLSGAVLVIEDLTELLAAQRAAAWQEVARRMAHEIKNPLTPIQLAAERIAKNFHRHSFENGKESTVNGTGQMAKIVDQSTETILQEVSSLKAMVDEFSQFARLPHAQLEAGDLNEIVRQTALLYEDRLAGVRLETNLAVDLPSAMLDTEQLRRVFVNLIENAIEAFDPKQSERTILIKTWHDAGRGLIFAEISDNGPGIAATEFAKLFQPYFSTKGRGTGLGLAIVQRIIGEHSGRIRAASNLPQGAKFIVELPLANA
jgi:nitrogen fixation/metabolism regulation signal transduction histidine kinase